MSIHLTPLDISNLPDLVRLVEEMKHTKQPRILKQDSETVAMLMPMETATQRHKAIDSFDFKPLDEVKTSFLEAGYSEAEVNDMLEAMSELPQYAGQSIRESK
jgi:hypothetical protein